jgi:flagellar protein FlgJ
MTNTIFNDIGYLSSLRAEAASAPNKAINEVASQFEALFIQQMMKSMRDAGPKSDLMNSDHLDTYQAMADQQMAVSLSQQGGIGIARMLVEQMQTRGYVAESQSTERGMALPGEESLNRFDIETSDAVLKGGVDG